MALKEENLALEDRNQMLEDKAQRIACACGIPDGYEGDGVKDGLVGGQYICTGAIRIYIYTKVSVFVCFLFRVCIYKQQDIVEIMMFSQDFRIAE